MEYANQQVYTIDGTRIVANKYPQPNEIAEQLSWVPLAPQEQVAEYLSKKSRVPVSIEALESQNMVFVGYDNSCITLRSDLTPIQGLSMRSVSLLLVEGSTVAAFTQSTIQVMTANDEKLQLKKSIDCPGVRAAAIAGTSLLVATEDLYELIDLTIDSKIPLFPTPATPIVVAVNSREFLIIQGTSNSEPAIGLVVTFTGEASRQPIMWDSYPLQVHADGDLIISLFETKVLAHSVSTQSLVKEWLIEEIWPHKDTVPKLSKTHTFKINSLDELVGPVTMKTHTCLYHQSQVAWLVPPSQIPQIEAKIKSGEKLDLTHLEGPEREYAEVVQCLYQVEQARPQLPPISLSNVIFYIFGDELESNTEDSSKSDSKSDTDGFVAPFPGLGEYILHLKNASKTPEQLDLYRRFLQSIKPVNPRVERIIARLLTGDELLDHLVSAKTGKDLASQRGPDVLEKYYMRTNSRKDLLDLWYSRISESSGYAKKIVDYLVKVENDPDLVWSEAVRLIKVSPKTGVLVFTKKSKATFDPEKVLDQLAQIQPGGVAWRLYLKHLVYAKGRKVFAQDLVMVVVQDLIDMYTQTPGISELVAESYAAYRALGWPKRPYFHFLQAQEKIPEFSEFVNLELEFASLVKDGSDMAPLISIIDESAPGLYVERCAVYRKLELHTQCLDFLIADITDYVAAIWYCLYDSQGKPHSQPVQEDLAKYTLKQLLAHNAPEEVIAEHLEKQRDVLGGAYIISSVPETTHLSTVGESLKWHFEQLSNQKNCTRLAKTLSIGDSRWHDAALANLAPCGLPSGAPSGSPSDL